MGNAYTVDPRLGWGIGGDTPADRFRLEAARMVGVSPNKLRSDMTRDQAERFDACVTDLTHDYLTRDSAWIERELGDVPVRERLTFQGVPIVWDPSFAPEHAELRRTTDGQVGRLIPVESLGRDQ